MSKRIEIDGKFYRERRGKLVEIPAEWVGKTVTKQKIRKRKEAAKNAKKFGKDESKNSGYLTKQAVDVHYSGKFSKDDDE